MSSVLSMTLATALAPLDRIGVAPPRALPSLVTAQTAPRAALAARRTLGLHPGAGSPALESGLLAQIDGLAAFLRAPRETSPAELDDEAARGIALTLQRMLAQAPAPLSGESHAALLRLLA